MSLADYCKRNYGPRVAYVRIQNAYAKEGTHCKGCRQSSWPSSRSCLIARENRGTLKGSQRQKTKATKNLLAYSSRAGGIQDLSIGQTPTDNGPRRELKKTKNGEEKINRANLRGRRRTRKKKKVIKRQRLHQGRVGGGQTLVTRLNQAPYRLARRRGRKG